MINQLINDIMETKTNYRKNVSDFNMLINQIEKQPSIINKFNRKDWKKKRKSTQRYDYIIMMKEK